MSRKLSYVDPRKAVSLLSWMVLPEFHVNVNNDEGVKEGEGKMVEWCKKVEVIVVLKFPQSDLTETSIPQL